MKNITKILVAVVGMLTLALQNDMVAGMVGSMLAAHPHIAAVVVGLSGILSLIHVPKADAPVA